MAQQLTTRTPEGKRLVLRNGQAKRAFSFGGTWNEIRVGILVTADGSISISGAPGLWLGLMSGTANGVGDVSATHVIGVKPTGASASYNAGPPAYYTGSQWMAFKKVGTTVTSAAMGGVNLYLASAAPVTQNSALFLQVIKGSPFIIRMAGPNAISAVQANVTAAQVDAVLDLADFTNVASVLANYSTGSWNNLTINEGSDGTINGLNIWWERTSVGIEIPLVRFKKVS